MTLFLSILHNFINIEIKVTGYSTTKLVARLATSGLNKLPLLEISGKKILLFYWMKSEWNSKRPIRDLFFDSLTNGMLDYY